MDRSMSASPSGGRSVNDRQQDGEVSIVPPWEQRDVGQVPFMKSSSTSSSQAERASDWPTYGGERWGECQRDHRTYDTTGWKSLPPIPAAPKTAPSLPSFARAPYETVTIVQGPKTAPSLPSFVKAPPSPPDSYDYNRSRSSTKSSSSKPYSLEASPQSKPPMPAALVTALPGTMATRNRSSPRGGRNRNRTCNPDRDRLKKEKLESNGFAMRLKVALKDMFKREPVDETQFERIGDKHWTDD